MRHKTRELTAAYLWMLPDNLAVNPDELDLSEREQCVCEEPTVAMSGQTSYNPPCWSDRDLAKHSVCSDSYGTTFGSSNHVMEHIKAYLGRDVSIEILSNQLACDDVAVDISGHECERQELSMYGCSGMVHFAGPYLPHWILHPVHCTTEVIKQIERWYFNGWIPRGLYTLWIEAACPLYVSDTSLNSQTFWDTACQNILKLTTEAKFKVEGGEVKPQKHVTCTKCQCAKGDNIHYHVSNFSASHWNWYELSVLRGLTSTPL